MLSSVLRSPRFRDHDEQFAVVFDALRQLMATPQAKPPELGYHRLRGWATSLGGSACFRTQTSRTDDERCPSTP